MLQAKHCIHNQSFNKRSNGNLFSKFYRNDGCVRFYSSNSLNVQRDLSESA